MGIQVPALESVRTYLQMLAGKQASIKVKDQNVYGLCRADGQRLLNLGKNIQHVLGRYSEVAGPSLKTWALLPAVAEKALWVST